MTFRNVEVPMWHVGVYFIRLASHANNDISGQVGPARVFIRRLIYVTTPKLLTHTLRLCSSTCCPHPLPPDIRKTINSNSAGYLVSVTGTTAEGRPSLHNGGHGGLFLAVCTSFASLTFHAPANHTVFITLSTLRHHIISIYRRNRERVLSRWSPLPHRWALKAVA